jgi:hypothetical protein
MSAPASTSSAALDGRRFEGVVLERGKTSGDADTLTMTRDGQPAGEQWLVTGEVIG